MANGECGQGTGVTFYRKRELPIIAPALNNPGFLAAATDNMIKDTLIFGRESTPMTSPLVDGLSEEDIDDDEDKLIFDRWENDIYSVFDNLNTAADE